MLRILTCTVLALPLGTLPLCAQTITLVEGSPTSATVLTVGENDPNGQATVVLQDVELLPIEITGRTLGQENDVSRSRLLQRHGVWRVELPDGGRVLRYRRAGGGFHGFLHVPADGAARVVLERPAVAGADPFDAMVGVAPGGGHLAVPELAGGLWIVRLDGVDYASTGTPARFVAGAVFVDPASVMVGSQVVWFHSQSLEVFRCGLADGQAPVDVSPPPQANAILKDEMAMSRDGSRIVYLYGPQQQQRLWTVGLVGGPVVLPPAPSKYEDPGYLPGGAGEPAMLLNDDGSRLFFVDSLVRDELYLFDMAGGLPALQITDDPIFQPYIGVHVLPFFASDALTVAIGDPNRMDWFRAELTAGGGTVDNLTATGSTTMPFIEGTIDPLGGARTGDALLAVEQTTGGLALRRIDPTTGTGAVVAPDLLQAPRVGSTFGAAADVVVPTAGGDRLYVAGAPVAPLFTVPAPLTLDAPVTGPAFRGLWVELAGTGGFGISALYLPDGTFVTGPLEQGLEQICLTQQLGVVLVGSPVRYLAPGVFVVMNRPQVAWRRCLSGAGA